MLDKKITFKDNLIGQEIQLVCTLPDPVDGHLCDWVECAEKADMQLAFRLKNPTENIHHTFLMIDMCTNHFFILKENLERNSWKGEIVADNDLPF